MTSLLETAKKNLGDSIREALMHTDEHQALVVYDKQNDLTVLLTDAVRAALPKAIYMDFNQSKPEDVMAAINALKPQDLVILLQSKNFRLNEFRIRIELFQRQLKTMEMSHLDRINPDQYQTYVEALAYDPNYYRTLGNALKEKVEKAKTFTVRCAGTELRYHTPMEPMKLNLGDYRGMKNIGGTFPIGEVFTEPQDLTAVNGEIMICALGDLKHIVYTPPPFKAIITNGVLTAPDAPEEFKKTLALIQEQEPVWVREFGLGLNRAMTKHKVVSDITAFERMNGLHFSLGAKHAIYKKPGLKPKKTRYHIDIFVDVETILADDEVIFKNGVYLPAA
jgi:aminopeptidase